MTVTSITAEVVLDLTLTDAVGLHLAVARRVRSVWSTDFRLGLTGVPLVVGRG